VTGSGGGGGTVATVGTFDGIHRGHQAVLREVVRRAGEGAAGKRTSLLVTFDPHPLEVVNPSAAPRLLTLSDEKRARAAALGVERVEVVAFTPELARLGPEEFVRDVLRARFGGSIWCWGTITGSGAVARATWKWCGGCARGRVRHGCRPRCEGRRAAHLVVADPDGRGARRPGIGRARTRAAVQLTGGGGAGGRAGPDDRVPTINLTSPDPRKLLPPDGVYAVRVEIAGTRTAA